jgi:hypothetical protein
MREGWVEDRLDEHEERHHRKQLPDNVEAGDVLLEDKDHGANHEQEGQ